MNIIYVCVCDILEVEMNKLNVFNDMIIIID